MAYLPLAVNSGLGEVLSNAGLTLLRLAEAEKYAPVAFFLNGQRLLITDHGNIELMVDDTGGQLHTAYTRNLVPLLYIGGEKGVGSRAALSNITPTMLAILGLPQPVEMTSPSLLVNG